MKRRRWRRLGAALCGLGAAAAGAFTAEAADKTGTPVLGHGAFAVGSTDFELRAAPVAERDRCLNGAADAGGVWYVDRLLARPEAAFPVVVAAPAEVPSLGREVRSYSYLLYPTAATNDRPDRTVADGFVLPHAQSAGEAPVFAPGGPFPLVLFSHGYRVNPFNDLRYLVTLASHGYVVANLFHGDGRFDRSPSRDTLYAVRAASLSKLFARLRSDPDFGAAIDFNRAGIFGISLGGRTALSLLGGRAGGGPPVAPLAALRAGFGEVPVAAPFSPALGGDPAKIRAPFFAALCGDDPISRAARRALPRLPGPVYAVELPGQGHVASDAARDRVISTWTILFFDAWLRQDPAARATLETADRVDDPVPNRVVLRRPAVRHPAPGP